MLCPLFIVSECSECVVAMVSDVRLSAVQISAVSSCGCIVHCSGDINTHTETHSHIHTYTHIHTHTHTHTRTHTHTHTHTHTRTHTRMHTHAHTHTHTQHDG